MRRLLDDKFIGLQSGDNGVHTYSQSLKGRAIRVVAALRTGINRDHTRFAEDETLLRHLGFESGNLRKGQTEARQGLPLCSGKARGFDAYTSRIQLTRCGIECARIVSRAVLRASSAVLTSGR